MQIICLLSTGYHDIPQEEMTVFFPLNFESWCPEAALLARTQTDPIDSESSIEGVLPRRKDNTVH